jgi:hypothetical protein
VPGPAGAAIASGGCKPVWFIGARGSGESADGSDGMGAEVDYMASVAAADLAGKGVDVAAMPVAYSADSVDVLKPNATVLAYLQQQDTAAALQEYITTSVDKYDASMDEGIRQAEADVAAVVSTCPNSKIIMGGYSQGAVAVHDAENWLVKNRPGEFKHIAGTLLLGDPDRVSDTKAKEYGDSPGNGEGLRVYLCAYKYLCLAKPHDVPDPAATANIANTGDIVGDFSGIPSIENFKADAAVHTTYATTITGRRLLASAANWVASLIPGHGPADSSIRVGPADYGTIPAGKVTSEQLTAAGGTAPYSFHILSIDHGRTPGWVTVTAGGKLTIRPPAGTKAKIAIPVYATDHAGRHSPLTAATISFTVAASAAWAYSELPLPANAGGDVEPGLNGVSCPSASFCVAVGSYSDTSDRIDAMLLVRSGGSWTAAEAPAPIDATDPTLSAVSCPSASFCTAVGFYEGSGGQDPLLLTWSGRSWTAAKGPLPADSVSPEYAGLNAVSCPSASFCTAVGYYEGSGGQDPLLMTWSGGSWTAAKGPLPADSASPASAGLDAVSCPSASFCVAGGNYTGGDTASLMLTRFDGTWAATQPFTGHQGVLTGVSCPSASFCTAVGDYLVPTTTWAYQPEVLTWSGSAWAPATGPIPSGAVDVTWGSVSCPSSSYCAATGLVNYDPSSYEWQDLVRTWSGGSWTETSFPQAPSLADASCWSASDCVVVGTSGPGGGTPIALTSSG